MENLVKIKKTVTYVKFLGALMDVHLSFRYDIQELHQKLSKTFRISVKT